MMDPEILGGRGVDWWTLRSLVDGFEEFLLFRAGEGRGWMDGDFLSWAFLDGWCGFYRDAN